MVSVVVVAGGRSTRFGRRDKAIADLAGTPMVRRVADRLTGVAGELVVNCRAEQTAAVRSALASHPLDARYAEDEEPDRGPVAGIRNGLRAVSEPYAAVVACDMPFVEPALVTHLRERAAGHDAAVPRLDDGWFQTTQAVYRADAMRDACDAALARGDRRVLDALLDLDYVVVDEAEVASVAGTGTFENVNTPGEFEAAADRLDDS